MVFTVSRIWWCFVEACLPTADLLEVFGPPLGAVVGPRRAGWFAAWCRWLLVCWPCSVWARARGAAMRLFGGGSNLVSGSRQCKAVARSYFGQVLALAQRCCPREPHARLCCTCPTPPTCATAINLLPRYCIERNRVDELKQIPKNALNSLMKCAHLCCCLPLHQASAGPLPVGFPSFMVQGPELPTAGSWLERLQSRPTFPAPTGSPALVVAGATARMLLHRSTLLLPRAPAPVGRCSHCHSPPTGKCVV